MEPKICSATLVSVFMIQQFRNRFFLIILMNWHVLSQLMIFESCGPGVPVNNLHLSIGWHCQLQGWW